MTTPITQEFIIVNKDEEGYFNLYDIFQTCKSHKVHNFLGSKRLKTVLEKYNLEKDKAIIRKNKGSIYVHEYIAISAADYVSKSFGKLFEKSIKDNEHGISINIDLSKLNDKEITQKKIMVIPDSPSSPIIDSENIVDKLELQKLDTNQNEENAKKRKIEDELETERKKYCLEREKFVFDKEKIESELEMERKKLCLEKEKFELEKEKRKSIVDEQSKKINHMKEVYDKLNELDKLYEDKTVRNNILNMKYSLLYSFFNKNTK